MAEAAEVLSSPVEAAEAAVVVAAEAEAAAAVAAEAAEAAPALVAVNLVVAQLLKYQHKSQVKTLLSTCQVCLTLHQV